MELETRPIMEEALGRCQYAGGGGDRREGAFLAHTQQKLGNTSQELGIQNYRRCRNPEFLILLFRSVERVRLWLGIAFERAGGERTFLTLTRDSIWCRMRTSWRELVTSKIISMVNSPGRLWREVQMWAMLLSAPARLSHKLSYTGSPDKVVKVSGVTNSFAPSVITTKTRAPCFFSKRTSSADL